jgi:plastocyanin
MKKYSFLFSLVIAGASLLLVSGCKGYSTSPSGYSNNSMSPGTPPSNSITISAGAFSPPSLTVAKHTTVTWYNSAYVAYTATSNLGLWDTGNIPSGSSRAVTFDSVGTFPYHSVGIPSMAGTIIVQ